MNTDQAEFQRRLQAALRYARVAGISESDCCPPMYKVYWKMGLRIPPPHFLTFMGNVLIAGTPGGISLVGLYMLHTGADRFSVLEALLVLVVTTALWGGLIGVYYQIARKRYRIPHWKAL